MRNVWLVMRYRALSGLRWLKEHAFVSFVLAPMIMGGSLLVVWDGVVKGLEALGAWLSLQPDHQWVAGVLAVLAVPGVLFSAALRDTFGLRTGEGVLDAQPIAKAERFHADLLTLAARNLPIALALFLTAGMLGRVSGHGVDSVWLAFDIGVFCLVLACLEMAIVVACVAAGMFQGWRLLGPGLLTAGIAYGAIQSPGLARLVAMFVQPMGVVGIWVGDWQSEQASVVSQRGAALAFWTLGALAFYVLARLACVRLREPLRHRVVDREATKVPALVPFAEAVARRWGPSLVAQLKRDWRLALRGFSPAAGFCLAAGILPHFAAFAYFARNGADAETVRIAAQSVSALSCAAMASVGFFLLSYELRYFWAEKSAASSLDTIWQSKVAFALLISAPGAVVAAAWGGLLHPGGLQDRALTALAALAIGPIVASFMGLLSFEVANRPGLGVLLSALVAVGAGVITAIKPVFWLLLVFAYGQGMHALGMRAKERVRFTEIET